MNWNWIKKLREEFPDIYDTPKQDMETPKPTETTETPTNDKITLEDLTLKQIKDLKSEIRQKLVDVICEYQTKYDIGIIDVKWKTDIGTIWGNPDGSVNFDCPTGIVITQNVDYNINIKFSNETEL